MKRILILIVLTIITLSILYNIIQSQRLFGHFWKVNFKVLKPFENNNKTCLPSKNSTCNEKPTETNTVPVMNKEYLLDNHVYDRIGSIFSRKNDSLETTVRCVGPLRNQSCLYKNLYFINNTFIILTIKGKIFPVLTVRADSFETKTTTPDRHEFDSNAELEKFVRNSIDPIVLPGVTVFFTFPWLGNIGHTLFDALYPPYAALIRFPPRHLYPFRLLSEIDECSTCGDEDILNRFSGLGILKHYILKDMSNGTWFVFDELVMGSGMMGQRCTQPNLQLPGGVELDGSRLFRDRMYAQHGILPPARRFVHSAENRNQNDVLRAYIIDNKRYTGTDRNEINSAINEINNYTITYQKENINNISKLEWPLINISYLYYGDIRSQKRKSSRFKQTQIDARSPTYELQENHFAAQLRLMRTMDIHIVGPGTCQMYQTFLPDGSVVINLGGLQHLQPQYRNVTYTTYFEQYMTSGAPYLKGLYYPINERPKGIKKEELVKLILQAAKLIMNGFSIPVNPIESLAPDGRLFIEMCEKDKKFCELVTSRAPGVSFGCYHFWVDEVIHERGIWKRGDGIDGNTNVRCPFNRTLMHQLRNKYGIHHQDVDVH